MGAGGFGTLAGHFPDRTVVTYDPRGVERSTKADPSSPSTPEQHADDLHRIIAELGAGPVDLFASSGGAVNALALVAKHPEHVRTLVAHEPPLASILPDREGAMALTQAIHDTYERSGFGAGMAQFIVAVGHKGPIAAEFAAQPAPDPAMFGLPTGDDGNRTDPLLGPEHHHLHALRARLRRAASGLHPDRARRRRRVGGRDGPPRRRGGRGATRHGRPWPSRAATAASSVASTASPAIPMPSPRSCARSSPKADRPEPGAGAMPDPGTALSPPDPITGPAHPRPGRAQVPESTRASRRRGRCWRTGATGPRRAGRSR